jgi:hypothetical protein
MSQVTLDLQEADGRLPDVCMRSGAPVAVMKDRSMAWTPPRRLSSRDPSVFAVFVQIEKSIPTSRIESRSAR